MNILYLMANIYIIEKDSWPKVWGSKGRGFESHRSDQALTSQVSMICEVFCCFWETPFLAVLMPFQCLSI